jgi:hypothetical protein
MNPPKQVLIPLALAQSLVDYLKQRPYVEVAQMMQALIQAPAAELVQETKP